MSSTITKPRFEPLDPRKLEHDALLSQLQGNIIKGHGRDFTVHLFVRFKTAKKKECGEWIGKFARTYVTTCKEQLRQRELYKRNQVPGGLFGGIYFTRQFYADFGFDLTKFDPLNGKPFTDGMRSRAADLADEPEQWEEAYQSSIHAMVLLAHDDLIALNKAEEAVCHSLLDYDPKYMLEAENPIADVVTTEYGAAIRNSNDDGLEHFGYVDGISQPLFLKDEVDAFFNSNDHGVVYDPSAPLSLVLVQDPMVNAPGAMGSYFVYRKLEQDVAGFKEAEKQLAKDLKLADEDAERAGAMIVGRFEDGTPLTLSGADKMIGSGVANNFNYKETIGGEAGDNGGRCPFHAHIRKTNPRRTGQDPNGHDDQQHRMARRGITYGYRNVSTTVEQHFVQRPKTGVGLLFMSFQANIQNQFEFIQRFWSNNEGFEQPQTGLDPITGQGAGSRQGNYPATFNKVSSASRHSFAAFVKMLGGAYFFAPSLSFLLQFGDKENAMMNTTGFAEPLSI